MRLLEKQHSVIQEISNVELDKTGRFRVKNKRQSAKLDNPQDVLKITLLDVHLNNADRSEENYNLLFQTEESRYYAIDHAALFGGPAMKERFVPVGNPALSGKLVSSYLLRNILKFLSLDQIQEIVETYFCQCDSTLGMVIDNIFNSIPESWVVSMGLKERVQAYCLDDARLKLMKLLLLDRFYQIKRMRRL